MGLKRRNSLTGVRRLHHHRHDHSTNEEYQNIKSVRSRRSLSDFDDEFEEVAVLHDKQEAVGYDDNMLDFGCIDCMDTFFFMDFFRDPLSCDSREDGESGREGVKVPVKVNATIVTQEPDAYDDHDDIIFESERDKSVFVGEVSGGGELSKSMLAEEGAPVTSFKKYPVKSKNLSVPAKSLILLPNKLDAGEVAAIVSTYLPAFGALHHGSNNRENRFSRNALKHKKILVTGGQTNDANAVSTLALLGGAAKIFVLHSNRGAAMNEMGSHKVSLLHDDPEEWLPRVFQDIDLVVDLDYPTNFPALKRSIRRGGRIVCKTTQAFDERTICSGFGTFAGQASLCMSDSVSLYDFNLMCEVERDEVLRDLKFLIRLLMQRRLRPKIDKYITPRDISIMKQDMLHYPESGAMVCEPWRE